MVPTDENKYFCWYAKRHFPSALLINFQNTLSREHQIGSGFCYITLNKRLEQTHIVPKHFYSTALPPFWMTDKGDKCESIALLKRWKAQLKSEQKVQINPGSAAASCSHHRNKGNSDRARLLDFVIKIKFGEGKKENWLGFTSSGALCPLRVSV